MEGDEVEALKDESSSVTTSNSTETGSSCSRAESSSDDESTGTVAQTTLQISGLSLDCTRSQLLELLALAGLQHACNFIYVPVEFKNVQRGFGYGFANFTTPDAALHAKQSLAVHGLEANFSATQGLSSLISRFRNSSVMHPAVPDLARPAVFNFGLRVAFPAPTRAIKAPNRKR
jgi:RNA recognition motif-containing protein